jgi:hypothetical protein
MAIYAHTFTASYTNPGVLSIKEKPILENTLHLFPNPVSNILYINMENTPTPPEVKIYSMQGVLVLQTNGAQIDVSTLPNGMNIAEVNGVYRKIIKQ